MNAADQEFTKQMLSFAKSLKGRARTDNEEETAHTAKQKGDKWLYFMVHGTQPETQAHIDETIRQLEKCDNPGDQMVCWCRLEFEVEALGLVYPPDSILEKQRQEYLDYKSKKGE